MLSKAAQKKGRKRIAAASLPDVDAFPDDLALAQALAYVDDSVAAAPAKRQRKRKADAHEHKETAVAGTASGTAAATQLPPVQAAAAASPLAAASAPNLNERAAVAAASATATHPIADAPQCPVCLESYDCDEAKEPMDCRIPRTLPCTHSACSGCLLKIITDTPGRVECPTCSDDRPVQLPAGMAAAAVSTPAAWLRCVPQSSTIIESIRRSQQLEAHLQLAQSQQQRCSYPACAAAAVKWCEECDSEMCAAHDASTHARSLSGHKRVLLAHKQAEQQQRLQSARASAGAELKRDVAAAVAQLAQAVSGIAARVRYKDGQAQQMQLELTALRAQEWAESKLLNDLRDGSERIAALSDADAQSHEADLDRLLQAAHPSSAADDIDVSLLDSLSHEEFGQLVRFLHKSGVGMSLPVLLYRASRDGFKRDDFVRCCANKGSTLTLVKVKDNGFIFGAYTHCQWPAAAGIVADPTGKSFLFSLVNATGKAVRFSLQDNDRAIAVDNSICIGAEKCEGGEAMGHSNVLLMYKGAADQKGANAANPFDATHAYQTDDGRAAYDETFFAGQQYFAAEQIEVYQL